MWGEADGTIHEYRQEFAKRASRVTNWSEHSLLGVFLNGLKDELKADVRLQKPRTVYKALSIALQIEAKFSPYKVTKGPNTQAGGRNPFHQSGFPYNPNQRLNTSWRSNSRDAPDQGPGRSNTREASDQTHAIRTPIPYSTQSSHFNSRFSQDNERQFRRDKGLCFRCGEKFTPGHRCKSSSLSIMEIADGEDDPEESGGDENEIEAAENFAEISLHAIFGKSQASTMKLHGKLKDKSIVILIDSGSTHNFIAESLVAELELPFAEIPTFGVQIGNGEIVKCHQLCKDLKLQLPGLNIVDEFYPFSLKGADVVLGIKWLASLNTIQANWNEMFLIFRLNGKQYKLQGIPRKENASHAASLQSLIGPMDTNSSPIPENIQGIVSRYASVFAEPNSLPPYRTHCHTIPLLPGSKPPNIRPYRYPHSQKTEIERQVEELLNTGFIRPSVSPFASPVLLVRKKDNSWRFCVDYRELNAITIPDKYPIPNIDELLDELNGAAYFSKIDLRSGYHQIRVHPDDIHKTAFRTHSGHYEFVVMPFGLTNAPATFPSTMNDLFRPFLRKCVLVFFDDILIYSKTLQQHEEHLQVILQTLFSNSYYANPKKCSFGHSSIHFLGHQISHEGVSVDNEKVAAVMNWPQPKSVKELRGFLGLTGYYRRFVQNYGIIARPLTDLTKKDAFQWNPQAEAAFQQLKKILTTVPVLRLPNFALPFIIECDASSAGVGAILLQNEHPVAYYSKGFSFSNRYKSTYERELLALVLAIQKWRHYLFGTKFVVRTDHGSLKYLLDQRVTTPSQQRLILKLLPFDFSITYKPGKENTGADALSHKPHTKEFLSMVIPIPIDFVGFEEALLQDPFTKELVDLLKDNPTASPPYALVDGKLFYNDRLVIPNSGPIRQKLLEESHSSLIGGHGGFLKTLKRLSATAFWPHMKRDVRTFVQQCMTCQQTKYQTLAPAGLLQPLPIPQQV